MQDELKIIIEKRNTKTKCRVCKRSFRKGEKRISSLGNYYLPIHYDCFLYLIIKKIPEVSVKNFNIKDFEKILIARTL